MNIIHFGVYYDFDEVPFVPLTDLVEGEKGDKFITSKLDMCILYNGELFMELGHRQAPMWCSIIPIS